MAFYIKFTDKTVMLTAAEAELIFDHCTNEIESIQGGETSYGDASRNAEEIEDLEALKAKVKGSVTR
jgi:hypothetical protein